MLEKLKYNNPTPIMVNLCDGIMDYLYLEKTVDNISKNDIYSLKLYHEENNVTYFVGSISFSCDVLNSESVALDTYIQPEYRKTGKASFLIAYWIYVCKSSGITNLSTVAIDDVYLAHTYKNFGFDLPSLNDYMTPETIFLCERKNEETKGMFPVFDSEAYETKYRNNNPGETNIAREIDSDTIIIDEILLGKNYELIDSDEAYARVRKVIDK